MSLVDKVNQTFQSWYFNERLNAYTLRLFHELSATSANTIERIDALYWNAQYQVDVLDSIYREFGGKGNHELLVSAREVCASALSIWKVFQTPQVRTWRVPVNCNYTECGNVGN